MKEKEEGQTGREGDAYLSASLEFQEPLPFNEWLHIH